LCKKKILTKEEIEEQVRKEIEEFFTSNNITCNCGTYNGAVIELFNLFHKWIVVKKRRVEVSKKLQQKVESKALDQIQIDTVNSFKEKFELGVDMNSHLSKNILKSDEYDMLLNNWGIRHLHLCDQEEQLLKTSMGANRSDYYLLIIVNDDCIYFIDVVPHLKGKNFADVEMLKTIEDSSWMDKIGMLEMPNINKVYADTTNMDFIYEAWKSKVNVSVIPINGKYYIRKNLVTVNGANNSVVNGLSKMNAGIEKILKNKTRAMEVIIDINEHLLLIEYGSNNKILEYIKKYYLKLRTLIANQ